LWPDWRVFIIATVTRGEHTCGNVVLQELFVDRVDDVRNDHADKILTTLQSGKIICSAVSVDRDYGNPCV